jgi:taurine dioxygenase
VRSPTASKIELRPSTGVVGAEILGIDLRESLSEEAYEFVHGALMKWGVVFFRDQSLSFEQQIAFGKLFGELAVHPVVEGPPGYPEILIIHTDDKSTWVQGEVWHADVSASEEPPSGSILRIETVPESGGDTLFANMNAAYEALSKPMQDFLSTLTATHSAEHLYSQLIGERKEGAAEYPRSHHPVVRTHPVTGRRTLYVNSRYTTQIDGLSSEESDALLQMLFRHILNPNFQCRFHWHSNSIAFWDNCAVQHFATWDYFPQLRHGYRITLKGDRPYFDSAKGQ